MTPHYSLQGLTASRHEGGLVGIAIAQQDITSMFHVFLLRTEAMVDLDELLDDLTIMGVQHKGANLPKGIPSGWEKYDDEFMTGVSARRYAEREMSELRKAGADNEPYYTGDASLDVDASPLSEAMKRTLRGEDPEAPPKPAEPITPTRRFSDDDDDFASRFQVERVKQARARIPRPTPEQLVASESAGVAPVRMVEPDSASGGKFWEIYVTEHEGDPKPWHVDVRFGSVGTRGQMRNVAKCRTKGMAMDVRRERINRKRKKGYAHTRMEEV